MSAGNLCFVDTNILLYAFDAVDAGKQHSAERWLKALWDDGLGRLSWQVLNEFYYNATRKIGAPPNLVRSATQLYALWQPSEFHLATIERAWYWTDHGGVNYWDGLILAAAEASGCSWLLTEDFQEGRKYATVQVVNPFKTDPGSILKFDR